MLIQGHHHISLYAKDAEENIKFYTDVLGLRLVGISVNQDNTRMFHIYYGDQAGHPGTIITFFEISDLNPQRKGTNSIYRFSLLVPSLAALNFFKDRLTQHDVAFEDATYLDQVAIHFEDNNGAPIALIVNDDYETPSDWAAHTYTDIPAEYQILGMGPIELRVRDTASTLTFLTDVLDFKLRDGYDHIVSVNPNGLYSDIVIVQEQDPLVKVGYGYTHHIALSVQDTDDLEEIIRRIDSLPGRHTPIIDRGFFHSLYYRQNRIMYEFATRGPGFLINTTIDKLGQELILPDHLESQREDIENHLKPIWKQN